MSGVWVTPKLSVPIDRFIEWMSGIRPLPGQDAHRFFETAVATHVLDLTTAGELLDRHLRLEAIGAGECSACSGSPPSGFTCNACGTTRPNG